MEIKDSGKFPVSCSTFSNTENSNLHHQFYELSLLIGKGKCSSVHLLKSKSYSTICTDVKLKNYSLIQVRSDNISSLDDYLAIKMFPSHYSSSFFNEKRILESFQKLNGSDNGDMVLSAKKQCKNIIRLIDSFIVEKQRCLILEHANKSLMEIIAINPTEEQVLPLRFIQRCCKDVLSGLAFLHGFDLLHGDLKPSNILWCGQRECFVIADFSHSAYLRKLPMQALQSDNYRAPEANQFNNLCENLKGAMHGISAKEADISTKIDIWSLGCVICDMKSIHKGKKSEGVDDGTITLDGKTRHEMNKFIELCLKINPAERIAANEALEHSFLKCQPQPTNLSCLLLPSRFLKLENIFARVEQPYQIYNEEILQDVKGKCEEFGAVDSVCFLAAEKKYNAVFVVFKNTVDCVAAQKSIMGMKFDGNTVIATFMDHESISSTLKKSL